ncbi:MAG TPA: SACOL1771 family peroxiredoxin [Rhodanobacteraceae bacterium]
MSEHHFHFSAAWPGGRNSVGTIDCGHLKAQVSIDTGMGGPGVGTNPDEMLLGAAATCYLMTLAAMLERAQLPVARMVFESDITVTVDRGAYRCKEIVHRPAITLPHGASAADLDKLRRLTDAADRYCMVSNALRGNVAIEVRPQLDIAD